MSSGSQRGHPSRVGRRHPDLGRSLVSSAVARRRSRSQETGRERTEQGTNGPFTVDTPISRECRTSSDSWRTDDDKRNRRVVIWMVAAGRAPRARRPRSIVMLAARTPCSVLSRPVSCERERRLATAELTSERPRSGCGGRRATGDPFVIPTTRDSAPRSSGSASLAVSRRSSAHRVIVSTW